MQTGLSHRLPRGRGENVEARGRPNTVRPYKTCLVMGLLHTTGDHARVRDIRFKGLGLLLLEGSEGFKCR
jgi:hypothetical protein